MTVARLHLRVETLRGLGAASAAASPVLVLVRKVDSLL